MIVLVIIAILSAIAIPNRDATGALTAPVLAELPAAEGRVAYEADLADRCGASRAAGRSAIENLQAAGAVQMVPRGRARAVEFVCGAPSGATSRPS